MGQDLRLALRAIARSPSYAAMVIGSLAIGIAAPVLAFSIVNAALFRPLDGIGEQDRLVRIGLTGLRGQRWFMGSTAELYRTLRDQLRDMVDLAAAVPATFAISSDHGEPVVVNGEIVSPDYFETLRVRPVAGRLFASSDAAAPTERIAVISHGVWQQQFQRSPDVVGQFITVNGAPLQVVGVAPEHFSGAGSDPPRLWIPFGLADLALRREGRAVSLDNAGPQTFAYFGRLKGNTRIGQVEAAASPIVYRAADGASERRSNPDRFARQLMAVNGDSPTGAVVTAFWRGGLGPEPIELVSWLAAAMALPFLVLAIACINAGNLVLARATRTATTWRLQLALGASRTRLLRQPVAEGLLLAFPAAALGLLLTRWGFVVLDEFIPFGSLLTIDWRVAVFAFATAAATPLLFGIGPVWRVLARARHGSPGRLIVIPTRSRARAALLVLQAGLSVALLGTGTQFVRTVRAGFDDGLGEGDRMIVATFEGDRMNLTDDATDTFYTTVLDRVRTIPGAGGAALLAGLNPIGRRSASANAWWWLPEDPVEKPRGATVAYMTPGALDAIGASFVSGRPLTASEYGAPVRAVLVNERFVQQLGGRQIVGAGVRLGPSEATGVRTPHNQGIDVTIVGVVRVTANGRDDARAATVYVPAPLVNLPSRVLYIPFGDSSTAKASLAAVRDTIRAVTPRVPYTVRMLEDARWRRSNPRRFIALAVTIMGGLALLLAGVGLYGAASYAVEARTREIGVRMAVGATSGAVLRGTLREAMTIAAVACAAGGAAAAAVAIIVRSTMYGTSAIDPIAYGATMAILLTTMLLASLVPAARAARIDPVVALRAD